MRETEILFFLAVVVMIRSRKTGNIILVAYLPSGFMYAKCANMILFFMADPRLGLVYNILFLLQGQPTRDQRTLSTSEESVLVRSSTGTRTLSGWSPNKLPGPLPALTSPTSSLSSLTTTASLISSSARLMLEGSLTWQKSIISTPAPYQDSCQLLSCSRFRQILFSFFYQDTTLHCRSVRNWDVCQLS